MEDLQGLFATTQTVLSQDQEGCLIAANVTERKTWLETVSTVDIPAAVIAQRDGGLYSPVMA